MGKTKDVLRLTNSKFLGFRFKDNILGRAGVPDSGGNEIVGQKPGKGAFACAIACAVFEELRRAGVPNHFVERLSEDSVMVRRTDPVRIEFIARNFAFGGYLRAHPAVPPLTPIPGTRELTLKDDARDDPVLTDREAFAMDVIRPEEMPAALALLDRVADTLTKFYESKNMHLCDLKLEVGRTAEDGRADLIVIDDLGFDNTRVLGGDRILGVEELHATLFD